jgi:hypothetical protein
MNSTFYFISINQNPYPQNTPPLLRGAGGDRRSRLDEIIADLDALEGMLV